MTAAIKMHVTSCRGGVNQLRHVRSHKLLNELDGSDVRAPEPADGLSFFEVAFACLHPDKRNSNSETNMGDTVKGVKC